LRDSASRASRIRFPTGTGRRCRSEAHSLFNWLRNNETSFRFHKSHIFLEVFVKIRAGYDIAFQCPYAVPMVLMLTTHPSRDGDILGDQSMRFSPGVDARDYTTSMSVILVRPSRALRFFGTVVFTIARSLRNYRGDKFSQLTFLSRQFCRSRISLSPM